jgi:hypothetical protein
MMLGVAVVCCVLKQECEMIWPLPVGFAEVQQFFCEERHVLRAWLPAS